LLGSLGATILPSICRFHRQSSAELVFLCLSVTLSYPNILWVPCPHKLILKMTHAQQTYLEDDSWPTHIRWRWFMPNKPTLKMIQSQQAYLRDDSCPTKPTLKMIQSQQAYLRDDSCPTKPTLKIVNAQQSLP
jgi:hypothetical protein